MFMKFIKIILKIILISITLFCAFKIFDKEISYYKDDKENINIQKEVAKNTNVENMDNKLLKINRDYKLWIEIPNTKVNYPVVQTYDNKYYLNHSFNKNINKCGTLFIYDKYNFKNSQNLIIFGHNMRNDSMFGTLTLFKDKKFFDENSIINIIQGDYIYKYEIFGVCTISANNFKLKDNFDSKEEFQDYIDNLKYNSQNWRNIDLNLDSKLLTLYTCTYEFDDSRLIVISKLFKKIKLSEEDIGNINNIQ